MIIAIIFVAVLCFGLVVFVGAPYLPTLKEQKNTALDLLSLKSGDTLMELGSGDGRVLNAAAERGLYAIGYELNPILVIISRILTFRHRRKIRIIWGNYWSKDWQTADGIYVFLHSRYMEKLDMKLSKTGKKIKLVSIAFKIPGKKPVKSKNGVFLYQY